MLWLPTSNGIQIFEQYHFNIAEVSVYLLLVFYGISVCVVLVINLVQQESVPVGTDIAPTEKKGLENLCNKCIFVKTINAYEPCFTTCNYENHYSYL